MSHNAKILYVEDDISLAYVTKDNLELQGYFIECCEDGKAALEAFNNSTFDICILDVMLPKLDGFSLAKKIREKNQHIPIIFLTAKSTKEDKIHGLKTGADDYLTKPFSIEELLLKIEIFLKRSKVVDQESARPDMKPIGNYQFDLANQLLIYRGESRQLTIKEAELLNLLLINVNNILRRDEILKILWGNDDYFKGRSLDVFISRLRKYLSEDLRISIENVHSVGFVLKIK
jgi:DNA-binding response OmpR family regulator